jgi:hypothetical protein
VAKPGTSNVPIVFFSQEVEQASIGALGLLMDIGDDGDPSTRTAHIRQPHSCCKHTNHQQTLHTRLWLITWTFAPPA